MLSFSMLYAILTKHLCSNNEGQERDKHQSPNFTRENGGIGSIEDVLLQGPKEVVGKERNSHSFFTDPTHLVSCLPCLGVMPSKGDSQTKYTGLHPQGASS